MPISRTYRSASLRVSSKESRYHLSPSLHYLFPPKGQRRERYFPEKPVLHHDFARTLGAERRKPAGSLGTCGQAEAKYVAPVSGRVTASVRRPAVDGHEVPATAPIHPAQSLNWLQRDRSLRSYRTVCTNHRTTRLRCRSYRTARNCSGYIVLLAT